MEIGAMRVRMMVALTSATLVVTPLFAQSVAPPLPSSLELAQAGKGGGGGGGGPGGGGGGPGGGGRGGGAGGGGGGLGAGPSRSAPSMSGPARSGPSRSESASTGRGRGGDAAVSGSRGPRGELGRGGPRGEARSERDGGERIRGVEPRGRRDGDSRVDRGDRRVEGRRDYPRGDLIRRRGARHAWGPGITFWFYDGYYYGDCDWLYRRAVSTGSRYWWSRYRLCRSYDW